MAAEDSTALLLLVQSLPVSEWGAAELRELVKVFLCFYKRSKMFSHARFCIRMLLD